MEGDFLVYPASCGNLFQVVVASTVAWHRKHEIIFRKPLVAFDQFFGYIHLRDVARYLGLGTAGDDPLLTVEIHALDFVIDNYHYDSILYNKELYCEENILLAVPKHFAVNEELGMYQLSYKNIKNKNYLNQKYPAVPLGRFADIP